MTWLGRIDERYWRETVLINVRMNNAFAGLHLHRSKILNKKRASVCEPLMSVR
jgi:hypothetical protein